MVDNRMESASVKAWQKNIQNLWKEIVLLRMGGKCDSGKEQRQEMFKYNWTL